MATILNAAGDIPSKANPASDPRDAHYAIYIDGNGVCIGIEGLQNEPERKITDILDVSATLPPNVDGRIFQIWVQATPFLGTEPMKEYRTCYSKGKCFKC